MFDCLCSMDAFQQSCERDLKAAKLRNRQDKLKSLLVEESRQYEVSRCNVSVIPSVERSVSLNTE